MSTNNNRALMLVDATSIGMTQEELIRWKAFYAKDAPDEDFLKFIEQCVVYGTDPRRKRCFIIPRYDKNLRRMVYGYQISLSGLLSLAQGTGEFEGFTSVEFCSQNMEWHDVWPKRPIPGQEDTYPYACRVGVYRKGFRVPLMIVRYFHEMAYRIDKDTKKPVLNSDFWLTMPLLMAAKCTKSQCIREGFEEKAGGIYIPEEMHTSTSEMEYMNSLMQEDDRIPSTKSRVVESAQVTPVASIPAKSTEEEPVTVAKPTEQKRNPTGPLPSAATTIPLKNIPTASQLRKDVEALGMNWEKVLASVLKSAIAKSNGQITIEKLIAASDEMSPDYCAQLAQWLEKVKANRKPASTAA